MRVIAFFLFTFFIVISVSASDSDSTKHPVQISGMVSLNSNGVAQVPAFAAGKPVVMLNLSVRKGRFSYDPNIAYGLNFKPWIFDNWFHYRLVDKLKFELRTGCNVSMFFSEFKNADTTGIWYGQRYFTPELAGTFKFDKNRSLAVMLWYDIGVEPNTISGLFYNLMYDRYGIPAGRHITLGVNVMLFYIDYTGNNDGFFISPKFSATSTKLPLSLFFQAIQPFTSNMNPYPNFQYNFGIGFIF